MPSRRLTASVTCAALAAAAVTATAAPQGSPPVPSEPGAVCTPVAAWVSTARGDFWLSSPSTTCYLPGPPGSAWGGIRFGDGPLVGAATPRLVLREGERVTFHFAAPPLSVVDLEARTSPRARAGTRYWLSPFTTTWRARRGSGVLLITTTQLVRPPASMALPERLDLATYAAAYRAVERRRPAR